MSIWSIIERAAALYPETIGVVDGDQGYSYRELIARASSLAAFLRAEGIVPGDRISILEVNSLPFFEAYFAVAGLGAVLNPLNYRLAAEEIAFILADSGSRWLLASVDFAPLVEQIVRAGSPLEGIVWIGGEGPRLPVHGTVHESIARAGAPFSPVRVDEDEVAHLYYTSGTTGRAKGVMLTHRNVRTHALGTIAELGLSDRDVWGHIAPMFHLADAWATFAITWAGGRHVMVPRFEAGTVLRAIERERITISNLIPTMLNLMVKHPAAREHDYSSLRLILSGGAPIAPDVVERIIELFRCEYVQTYGMTETSPYLTLSLLKGHLRALPPAGQFAYRAKTGRPFITVELKVVADDGRPVAPDGKEVGEILVRGETITPGYWNRPEETAAAFTDGWLRTGDLAVLDAEGYVDIVDRKKDMIITGGENVYSVEVEHVLYRHPKILEAAVYGVPDEIFGEAVAAAVVLRPGELATADEIANFCRAHLAGYKTPRAIVFLPELPRTGSGKIYKRGLREGNGEF